MCRIVVDADENVGRIVIGAVLVGRLVVGC
jgi:hypothetical protein